MIVLGHFWQDVKIYGRLSLCRSSCLSLNRVSAKLISLLSVALSVISLESFIDFS